MRDSDKMDELPIVTLFMLESLDGKINSGNSDMLDVDRDWNEISHVKEGMHQYYEIEQTTDLVSLNTGRVMAKIGVNDRMEIPDKSPCTFVIIDNKPHLNERGVRYLCKWVSKLLLVTTNRNHVAFDLRDEYDNLEILDYDELDLRKLLGDLKRSYGVDRVTVQSGGNMNGKFLRENLFDYIHVVVAPILVGGKDTSTLIDGEAIVKREQLGMLRPLELMECRVLDNSFIDLKYKVIK